VPGCGNFTGYSTGVGLAGREVAVGVGGTAVAVCVGIMVAKVRSSVDVGLGIAGLVGKEQAARDALTTQQAASRLWKRDIFIGSPSYNVPSE